MRLGCPASISATRRTSAPIITRGSHRGNAAHAHRPNDRHPPWHEFDFGGHSRGHVRFMIIGKGSVNADVFIEFLKRPITRAPGAKSS